MLVLNKTVHYIDIGNAGFEECINHTLRLRNRWEED
jgi:hypothetical protein